MGVSTYLLNYSHFPFPCWSTPFRGSTGQLPNFRLFFGADPRAFNSFGKTRPVFGGKSWGKSWPPKRSNGFWVDGFAGICSWESKGALPGIINHHHPLKGGWHSGGSPWISMKICMVLKGWKGHGASRKRIGLWKKSAGEPLWWKDRGKNPLIAQLTCF